MRVYVAAAFNHQAEARDVAALLTAAGHEVTSAWLGKDQPAEAPDEKAEWALADLEGVEEARALVLVSLPGGTPSGGRHVEFGYALALQKIVVLLGSRQNVFHYLASVKQFDVASDVVDYLGRGAK